MPAPSASFAEVPTVDRLVITSVVDGTYLAILLSRQLGSLSVERTRRPRQPSLAAEHGLAYHLVSQRGGEQRQVLLDFALTSQSLFTNLELLGIEPAKADALVLSHGHGDHYGGLLALAHRTPQWAERAMPLHAGGEDTFCRRWTVPGGRYGASSSSKRTSRRAGFGSSSRRVRLR
jgi:7,8-dihydropterin-6-yl-methyl-4-(beta-D-ribofuranosyl)aminobenzene 5'-phosphate synthase